MFTEKDLARFSDQNISVNDVELQIQNFIRGFPFLPVIAAATPAKGLVQLNADCQQKTLDLYNGWKGRRAKFVPASGAATRMFKSLFEAMEQLDRGVDLDTVAKEYKPIAEFFANLSKFAFYTDLKLLLHNKAIDIDNLNDGNYSTLLHTLLDKDGLMYGVLPKGLLAFHTYSNDVRTAFEEHLMEGALYGSDDIGSVNLHFTVSPEHRDGFEGIVNRVKDKYDQKYKVSYNISFSEQKKSTDTIAVSLDNQPFRNNDGSIVFRPGGHGALLENLNELNTELVFIKNIDNVVPEHHVNETVKWKKILAGLLLQKQQQLFAFLHKLDIGNMDENGLTEMVDFMEATFCLMLPEGLSKNEKRMVLYNKMNRPIRVCGMVKNVGEPGGGPFIAKNTDGSSSLQIAESSQIDMDDAASLSVFKASTHFNPVDIVCGVCDYKGDKFDLLKFRDLATGFISLKSKDGKELKAQELPGLWNGAMSDWNTIFVEVPLITFNPVKTINDLLRPEHQQ